MFHITITPITINIPLEFTEIPFFSRTYIIPGTIIEIPFSNRMITGLVIMSTDIRDMKSIIKNNDFMLRKIDTETLRNAWVLDTNIYTSIVNIANETFQPLGYVAAYFIDTQYKQLLKSNETLSESEMTKSQTIPLSISLAEYDFDICELSSDTHIIIVPTSAHLKIYTSKNTRDIIVVITPDMLLSTLYEHIQHNKPFHVHITNNSHSAYIHHQTNPIIDIRHALIIFCKHILANREHTITIYDSFFSYADISNYSRITEKQLVVTKPLESKKENYPVLHHIITPKNKIPGTPFHPDTITHIQQMRASGKRILCITHRTGIAGSLTCEDCSYTACCATCGHVQSLVVKNKKQGRVFLCHTCNTKTPVVDFCPLCRGILKPLGYTTEMVYTSLSELQTLYDIPKYIVDSNHVTTIKKLTPYTQETNHTEIIVTTPAYVPFISSVGLIIIISLEGLSSNPSYNTDTTMYRNFMQYHSIGPLLIQSKQNELPELFMKNKTEQRKAEEILSTHYHLPPEYILLRIESIILPVDVNHEHTFLQKVFKSYPWITTITERINPVKRRIKKNEHYHQQIRFSMTVSYPTEHNTDFLKHVYPLIKKYRIIKNPQR